ncbi:hypothetical protein ACFPYJ_17165 [Paenibacillus solisilvae]|uniref:Uncharacterized protein n=1 Tax=Paenibacillus solisilvae TaxID=2486751 RepID=A0ABW0W044_9BACL
MDKRKVIAAYQRGFMNVHECAQLLGIDLDQIAGLINDPRLRTDPQQVLLGKRSVNG